MGGVNRQWVLASHPKGMPDESNWRLREVPIPEPRSDEVLVRAIYLSVDPYMRARISPSKNYAKGVAVGEVMQGGGVGEVVRSRAPGFSEGDIVESMGFGWQEYAVLRHEVATKVDPSLAPIRAALGGLGMPGFTAYFALLDAARIQPGETVLISAAAGAVGQVAGQIAKMKGCRPVAVAGSDEKLAWCRTLGYEAGVNYRAAPDLMKAIREVCPNGVDVFLDNTAGPIHDAAMQSLAMRARVIVCGRVALAGRFEEPDIGPRFLDRILTQRARVQGFLVFDYKDRYPEALKELAAWYRGGKLQLREDVIKGIENMPKAFLRLLTGENFGKQLVKVTPKG